MMFDCKMTPGEQEKRLKLITQLPFHQFLGIEVLKLEAGEGELILHPSGNTINAGGVVHGGIIYSLLDACAYLAMMPLLEDHQNGVTHDIHASVLSAAPIDQALVFRGKVRKTGKRIVFCDSEAWYGRQLVATGRVTKSIINMN